MTLVRHEGGAIDVAPGETVLEALLRAGVNAPHSCRAGNCHSCMHRAIDGAPPAESQSGLTDAQRAMGYFLPCICRPTTPLTILRPDELGAPLEAVVRAIDPLSEDIVRLRVEADGFAYRPGQFVELSVGEDLKRHYSLASHPEEDSFLEMHIRLHPDGRMSRHLAERLQAGDRVRVAGPSGSCFYEGVQEDQPMLLIGAGTGLAPLYGVLRDAVRKGHRGPIRLYHGARSSKGLYLSEELQALSHSRDNIDFRPCAFDPSAPHGGDVAATALEAEQGVSDAAIFLCGGENLVKRLKRELFMRGASLKNIRSDAFTPAR